MDSSQPIRGRYAPSPTGDLHLGNIAAAIVSWLSIRSKNGTYIVRIDDLDPPRTVEGCASRMLEDLRWLGFDWDEGPDLGGPYGPYLQSSRSNHYDEALHTLARCDRLFPSSISRTELAEISSAPHGKPTVYPPEHRPKLPEGDWYGQFDGTVGSESAALRFKVDEGTATFNDRFLGKQQADLFTEVGDFVVKRKDGLFAYHLACAVDDVLMDIDEVIRGSDLVHSTFAQRQIISALGKDAPVYGHIPLVETQDEGKMSKRSGSLTIRALREGGVRSDTIIGLLAGRLGLQPGTHPASLQQLIAGFRPERVGRGPIVLTDRDLESLRQ